MTTVTESERRRLAAGEGAGAGPGGETWTRIETPIGWLGVRCASGVVRAIDFAGAAAAGAAPATGADGADGEPVLAEAVRQLRAYFERRLRVFDLPLDARGTAFDREVWAALRGIPYGETLSYGELARRVGRPGAARAVGAASGRNSIPIVIPCHRVIGADGRLTGFGGGLPTKRALLALEGAAAVTTRARQKALFGAG